MFDCRNHQFHIRKQRTAGSSPAKTCGSIYHRQLLHPHPSMACQGHRHLDTVSERRTVSAPPVLKTTKYVSLCNAALRRGCPLASSNSSRPQGQRPKRNRLTINWTALEFHGTSSTKQPAIRLGYAKIRRFSARHQRRRSRCENGSPARVVRVAWLFERRDVHRQRQRDLRDKIKRCQSP